ncbi:hypothetical protein CEUSTIGMA_g14036.t1, partial [Chlamydomonas eustigma]
MAIDDYLLTKKFQDVIRSCKASNVPSLSEMPSRGTDSLREDYGVAAEAAIQLPDQLHQLHQVLQVSKEETEGGIIASSLSASIRGTAEASAPGVTSMNQPQKTQPEAASPTALQLPPPPPVIPTTECMVPSSRTMDASEALGVGGIPLNELVIDLHPPAASYSPQPCQDHTRTLQGGPALTTGKEGPSSSDRTASAVVLPGGRSTNWKARGPKDIAAAT